ncbi:glycosyltransferase family 2 protein [Chlorogloeopsis fritschii PCC 9212]|uniref:Glycosyl transferase n=1 Tax=Chlorogloeopsis fritschii PCC 6912 TaxID=211165 RepID=A0A433NK07_CHLFR|nr:glycosyltransferase [Chlorogloeopsis fritschii]RUR83031.1 glycosyl transferase [Chlorogloeopsis fritschii PCC 6912]
MPKVSVVIPAYNAMEFLPETLASVLQQTFTDFEVLIVNDGSSDSIVEWASGITDLRVKLISQDNQGVSAARNKGIAHAQGKYVAFLDADDLWEQTKLEKQVRCLEQKSAVGLVYTWTVLIDELGKPTGKMLASNVEANAWKQLIENDMISTGSSTMIRHSCFDKVGVFDPSLAFAEDYDMWLRIAFCYPFAVVKEPLTLYRQHSNNTTKNRQKMIQGLRTVIEKTFQSVPLELLYLRNRAYASIFLGMAWLAVGEGDYKKAISYHQQALLHHPQVFFSKKCLRLSLAIATIRWFGFHSYDKVRKLIHMLRQPVLGVFS